MEFKKIKIDDFEFDVNSEDEKEQVKFINAVPSIVVKAIQIATKKLEKPETKEIASLDMITRLTTQIMIQVAPTLAKEVMEDENKQPKENNNDNNNKILES